MYKSFIINYAKNITKKDIINFINKNNFNVSTKDVDIIYDYIKKYYLVFFDNPIKYIKKLKDQVEDDTYYLILMLFDKYKQYL